jgi:hypothetical protein
MKNKFTIGIVLIIALGALVFNYIKAIEISPEELNALTNQNLAAFRVFTVEQGGTGASSFTAGECIVGNGTSALSSQACGSGTTIDQLG